MGSFQAETMLNNNPQTSRPTSLLLPPAAPPPTTYYPPTFQSLITPTTVSSPIVITPNTMKSIEQSILQTLGEDTEPYMMESQNYSGNFVPPLPSSTSTITLINTWQGGQVSSQEEDKVQQEEVPSPVPDKPKKQKKVVVKKQPKKKQVKVDKKPTEEEERRRIRRERNKLAAARCRKRRVDHTNKLLEETEGLESKKRALQTQITELQVQKEELEFILETHHCVKKIKDTVSVLSDLQNLPVKQDNKLKRPNTLNVGGERTVSVSTPAPPIPINTPSNGIAGLGFEPLCSDWGVSTPTPVDDKVEVSKSLVTPVNPYKKLQDL